MPVTVPVSNNVPASAAQQATNSNWFTHGFNGSDYDWWNPIDFLLPGTSALNNLFDPTGKHAAEAQYNAQLSLDNSARAFNANEAEKQRQWEKMMSDTAIQRQVADLEAAGLPKWLAVSNGLSGSSTPAGSSARSSSGSASKAENKLVMAAGIIATALRIFLMKH